MSLKPAPLKAGERILEERESKPEHKTPEQQEQDERDERDRDEQPESD